MESSHLDAISPLFQDCRDEGVNLALAFNHGSIPSPHGDEVFRLRDSLFYRLSAVLFHYQLLELIDAEGQGRTLADVTVPFFLENQVEKASYVFDDIVFNLMSLFDYTAGLLFYIYYFDHVEDLETALRAVGWAEIRNQAANANRNISGIRANRLHNSEVGPAIMMADESVVEKLRIYRNDIIHNARDKPSGSAKIDWVEERASSMTITAPVKFSRIFSYPDPQSDNILDSAIWLINLVFRSAKELLKSSTRDMKSIHNKSMDCERQG